MERHFTVSGFVCEGDATLLHWHQKLQIWLPAGGHIDANEDPIQAVVREAREETGYTCAVIPHEEPLPFSNIAQLPGPLKIIVADVGASASEVAHQHIDFSYALRPIAGIDRATPEHEFIWVTTDQLRSDEPLKLAACGFEVRAPEDVRIIGVRAIELVQRAIT